MAELSQKTESTQAYFPQSVCVCVCVCVSAQSKGSELTQLWAATLTHIEDTLSGGLPYSLEKNVDVSTTLSLQVPHNISLTKKKKEKEKKSKILTRLTPRNNI